MTSPAPSSRFPDVARFAVPPAVFLALRALASIQTAPGAAAETSYLALLAALVCTALAALSNGRELFAVALLTTTSAWIVEHGPHRGAVVTALLVVGLASATARRLSRESALPLAAWMAPAIGLQPLLRGDLLLPPLFDLRTLVSLVALPCAAAIALWILARRSGDRTALVAGAAAVVLAPGWNVTVTLALVSLAAGAVFYSPRTDDVQNDSRAPRAWQRWAALAVLMAPPLWDPALGILFSLGGLSWGLRAARAWWLPLAGGLALLLGGDGRPPGEILDQALLVAILLPGLILAPASRRPWALRGAVLATAAAVVGHGPDALASGLVMASLGPPPERLGAARLVQETWSAVLLGGVTLMATYPWLRTAPVDDALRLLGFSDRRTAAWMIPLAVLALVGAARLFRRARISPVLLGGLAVALLLAHQVPTVAVVPIRHQVVMLDIDTPRWTAEIPAGGISEVVIDSNLIHGAALPPGTWVAKVDLRDAEHNVLQSWQLNVGSETAEWAAARRDIADLPGFEAPPPWLAQLAPDGTFFAQRFRARFRSATSLDATVVRVRRNPELPEATRLALYRVELRR